MNNYIYEDEVSSELQQLSVVYFFFSPPGPDGSNHYTIIIDENGTLTREAGNDSSLMEIQLSQEDLLDLIEVIHINDFFNLPNNVDGDRSLAGMFNRELAITYNGKTHVSNGYNTENEEFIAICDYIENVLNRDDQSTDLK